MPAESSLVEFPEPKRKRGTGNRPRPGGDYETEWARCTGKAKELMLTINKARMEIAGLALQVCEINHGGGHHWSGFEGIKTLTDFACEIGINYKTISNWVLIRQRIMENLTAGEWDEKNYSAATRTLVQIQHLRNELDPEYVAAIYRREKTRKGSEYNLWNVIKGLKTIRNGVTSKINLEECEPAEIEAARIMLSDISEALQSYDSETEFEYEDGCPLITDGYPIDVEELLKTRLLICKRAVINLACRGRKRGVCLVAATQRLSKLDKDVAAECSNKMIGRTTLDIDVKRVCDEMHLKPTDHFSNFRNMHPGEFYIYGPALSGSPRKITVGPVETSHGGAPS